MQAPAVPITGQALQGGVHFLYQARTRGGWWLDFITSEGISDEWVTAYTGVCLTPLRDGLAGQLVEAAWKKIARRRWWLRGWAYNFDVPLDADSTIWAICLAERSGNTGSRRISRAYAFLDEHIGETGGVSTYSPKSPIHRHIRLPSRHLCAGWHSSHVCVTAAAAGLARFRDSGAFTPYLVDAQRQDGRWEGYWWADPEYTTALAVDALLASPGIDAGSPLLQKTESWLVSRLAGGSIRTDRQQEGSPFATACAVRALAHFNPSPERRRLLSRAAAWLIESQRSDGSWDSSARLRLPPPDCIAPDAHGPWTYRTDIDAGTIKLDQNRIYTTATVIAALGAFQARMDIS